MIYEWKVRTYKNVKAQDAGEYLKQLEEREGSLNVTTIIKESEPESALLHSCFEWDNAIAAQKYRESQARILIDNIVVVHETPLREEPLQVRAFVNVNTGGERKYISIETAMNNEFAKKQMLNNAYRELESFKKKYEDLNELTKIFVAIDDALQYVS